MKKAEPEPHCQHRWSCHRHFRSLHVPDFYSLQLALDVFERKLLGNALNANPWTRLGKEVLDSNLNRLATIERNVVNGLVEVNR